MNQIRLALSRPLAATACWLVLAGLWQIAEGAGIYAKAGLAQYLLRRAWSRTVAGERSVKPWPWADTWPVARLIATARGIDLIVLNGAYGRTMAFGPAYVESSAYPGTAGTTIVTGHRDTHFRFLKDLHRHETVVLETADGARRSYQIRNLEIVDARTSMILLDHREASLILITCYPFESIAPGGPLRYVVTAEAK
ncbi:MAG TPA: class GN sortase [Nitrospira sp.]|nr:class GN sortase [Nitrospira sp.]